MPAVEAYLALRRTAGYAMRNSEYLLRSFASFAAARGERHVRTATLIDWASQGPSVAQRHTRYQAVSGFASHLHMEDRRHELPPPNHFGYKKIRAIPHIYSRTEIGQLVLAASRLAPADTLRPRTYATLIGLLAVTGMRVSEALGLRLGDVSAEGLLIRKTKFQKTRLVPLHDSTAAALRSYLQQRLRMHPGGDRVFVGRNGQPMSYGAVHSVFVGLLKTAGVQASQGRRPKLHGFRHTFAVRTLESAPTGRQRTGQHMVALATYLGHVNIDATYWYLQTTPELLVDIATAAERFFVRNAS